MDATRLSATTCWRMLSCSMKRRHHHAALLVMAVATRDLREFDHQLSLVQDAEYAVAFWSRHWATAALQDAGYGRD